MRIQSGLLSAMLACGMAVSPANAGDTAPVAPAAVFDAALAQKTGADERGMRMYVLVVLRSGPTPVKDEAARKSMFAGHMANIQRLAKEGRLALAGPFGKNEDGWRGLFVFAVKDIEEARALTASDPVIVNGEMVADYYPWYSSAAISLVPELSEKLTPPAKPAP